MSITARLPLISSLRRPRTRRAAPVIPQQASEVQAPPSIEIAPNDPVVAYLETAPETVEIPRLELDSPAVRAMKEAGIQLAVPLVSQGELIGILSLGPRLSEQDYSADDRSLLNNLASQATPSVRVAQLVTQQKSEARERERIDQELQVARLIQLTLLPKSLPEVEGWHLAAHYRPARAVGGDFYDFIQLEDGRLGLVVGDVTDKGVPAALVMATTRSVMRAAAARLSDPGEVLARVNTLLCPDIPPNMFVTCLYAVLDPTNGQLTYANAGHDPPYQRTGDGVAELRARGMPLGLMPEMEYEVQEAQLEPGDTVIFYSDGLVEAHNPEREMFSFPRLRELISDHPISSAGEVVDFLLLELAEFTGPAWDQEDDITLVTLQRVANLARFTSFADELAAADTPSETESLIAASTQKTADDEWRTLTEFSLPSQEGSERSAIEHVRKSVEPLELGARTIERLETAVAEATMNAMEHGNQFRSEAPVVISVEASSTDVRVVITDQGHSAPSDGEDPDLELKLEGIQSPRGWGLFLIKNMVDELEVIEGESTHTIRLTVHRKEGDHEGRSV